MQLISVPASVTFYGVVCFGFLVCSFLLDSFAGKRLDFVLFLSPSSLNVAFLKFFYCCCN